MVTIGKYMNVKQYKLNFKNDNTTLWTILLAILLSSCSSISLKDTDKLEAKPHFTDFKFPKSISIPADDKLSEMEVAKAIEEIEKIEDQSKRNFVLRDLYIKGNDLKESDSSARAGFVYKILVHFYPKDFLINRDLVVSLIRATAFVDAEKYLKFAIEKKFSQESSFMLILAGLYSATGREKESINTYKEVLLIDKSNEEACIFLAKNLSGSGKSKDAINILNKCSLNSSDNPIFPYYIGKIYLIDDKKELAEKFFKKALKINPTYYQAALGRGLIKEEVQDFDGAVNIYKEYLELDAENLVILNRLVQTLFVLEKFENIIPYVEELIRQDSSNVNLKVKLGILYTEKKEYAKAIDIFENILKLAPESDKILYYLGALYQQIEKFENAIIYYSKIDKTSDLFFDSNLQISKLLRGLVSSISKEKYFEHLNSIRIHIDPAMDKKQLELLTNSLTFSEAYYHGHFQDFPQAISKMQELKEMDLTQKYFMANLYDKVKRFKDAIALMMGVIEENPKNAHALNFVGYLILENENDFDKAYTLIKKAIEIEPEDAYIRDSLGWYFFKIGDFPKALVELKKAWNSQKTDVIITKHLALVYQKLNNDIEAQKYFVEALKNCKEDIQRREILEVMDRKIVDRLPASLLGN